MKALPLSEVKTAFSACVREAEAGHPLIIMRHGRPAAALVPPADLDDLLRLRAAGPESGLASLAGGWEGSDELVAAVLDHRRSPSRPVPELGEA